MQDIEPIIVEARKGNTKEELMSLVDKGINHSNPKNI